MEKTGEVGNSCRLYRIFENNTLNIDVLWGNQVEKRYNSGTSLTMTLMRAMKEQTGWGRMLNAQYGYGFSIVGNPKNKISEPHCRVF
jgi:hypothetical protein